MAEPTYDWDATKAARNALKHRVTFEEAVTAFEDVHGLLIADPDHSDEESRFVLLATSARLRLLVVCHVWNEADEVVRIISARRATTAERRQYLARLPVEPHDP